jgi:cutinase
MLRIGPRSRAATMTESSRHGGRSATVNRRALIGIGVGIAALAMLMTATLPAGRLAIASASAGQCPRIQVVFARGTGEPPGVGRVGQAFVDSVRPLVGGNSVAVYAVDYPATRDFMLAVDGANDASTFIQNTAAVCPDTRFVLGGYSQGAAIMDVITVANSPQFGFANPMPADVAAHVAAVAVFGNPSNRIGRPLTALSPLYGGKTIDLCNGGDPVCSDGNDVPAHSLYAESGMASQAATFVAQRVSTPSHTPQNTAGVISDLSSSPTPPDAINAEQPR